MHRVSLVAALPLIWATLAPAHAQEAGVFGYVDAQTHAFRQVAAGSAGSSVAAAGTTSTGTFKLTLSVKTVTPSSSLQCSLDVSAQSSTGPIIESSSTAASVSGGNATCVVTLPYEWHGATASASAPIAVSFQIISATGQRLSQQGVALLTKVPANGSTTSYTVATTI